MSRTVAGEIVDRRTLDAEIASGVASEQALVRWLAELDPVDPTSDSRLPDWTIGHVMTHIARNADSVLSMFAGHPQYPHGREGRNADIEAGSVRSWSELVADVSSTSAAVVDAVQACEDWTGTVRMITGERQKTQIPLLRQREVEIHRTDLGLGYDIGDLPGDYVRRDLRLMEMLWNARQPMGMPLPDPVLAVDPAARLGWMMGRIELDGVDPAGLF
jgi:maleylpyruvate isomerase